MNARRRRRDAGEGCNFERDEHESHEPTPEHFFRKYPNGKATHVALFCGQYFDGTHSVWGKMNRAPSKGQLNVRLRRNGSLVTCKTVYPFSELFLAYGNAYRIVPLQTSH